ncbi:uncharacterized protein BKCO1_2300047 [Diplodia corticola]|uniref:Uncharacterized protein n=1 Tax=Diplodia corticola TaxID=236234 RepID=A0A1J9S1H5_9PEZI|nr:uncharacterized protein BKCO1_2300047 [Diplodia corticola]OJD34439.1 hypothetical protein BKCO1_2300047 [Diplodia corticola]
MAPINAFLSRATRALGRAPPARSVQPSAPTPPAPARPRCLVCATATTTTTTTRRAYAAVPYVPYKRREVPRPRIAQPSLWQNLVPKHFRSKHKRPFTWAEWKAKPWNPASVWIALGLLVGSNAINTLVLRRDTADFSRKADAKIALLREVLEKVQRGEDVDVERILGTGQAESEREWEEAVKEIEDEERTVQSRKRRKASAAETAPPAISAGDSTPANDSKDASTKLDYVVPQDRRGPVGFY